MKRMKRYLSLLLAMVMIVALVPVADSSAETKTSTNPIITQVAGGDLITITDDYSESDRYAVLTGNIKSTDTLSYQWETIVLGVSGTAKWDNYGFQFIYGTIDDANVNGIKLNESRGYGTFDDVEVAREQWYNHSKLDRIFSATGIDIKLVRLNTWAYLLANMGEGYELIGTMGVPADQPTQFTVFNANTNVEMSNIAVATGKDAALAAMDGMNLDLSSRTYFPVESASWTLEGKLTNNLSNWPSNQNRIVYAGTDGWNKNIAVMFRTDWGFPIWGGESMSDWGWADIESTHIEKLNSTNGGMWVRWVRSGSTLSLWTSEDGTSWKHVVENPMLDTEVQGLYIQSAGDYESRLTDVRITTTSELPLFEQAATSGENIYATSISGNYGSETYVVLTGTLKAEGTPKYDWSQNIIIGASGTTTWDNYGFQILYGTDNVNMFKTLDRGFGTYDDIEIPQEQWYNNAKLDRLFSDNGIGIKFVRLDTWAYLLADMGEGYELVARMVIPADQPTQFTIYNIDTAIKATNLTVETGKDNVLVAMEGMSLNANPVTYFPVNSTAWTIEGKLTTDLTKLHDGADNRIACVGKKADMWDASERAVAVIRNGNNEWKGQVLFDWNESAIDSAHSELLAGSGMWVRWVRDGEWISLWTSADKNTWKCVVRSTNFGDEATGLYLQSQEDFGSKMTNVAITANADYPADFLAGTTVSLGDNIGVNFYMEMHEDTLADVGAYVRFALPGENYTATQIMVDEATQEIVGDKIYYVFSCGIAAKEMTGDIMLETVRGDGTVVSQYFYQVRDYGNAILTDTTNYTDDDRTMVKALLNYGSYAQLYFEYKTDNLANAAMTEEDKIITLPTLSDTYKRSTSGTVTGLTYYGTSLMLTTKTAIRHYFELTSGNITDITFTHNGTTLTPVQKGSLYYVEITDIAATDLGEMYDLTMTKGTEQANLTYGPYTNVKAIVEGVDYSDSSKNMMAALYAYGQAAVEYQRKNLTQTSLSYCSEIPESGIQDGGIYNTSFFYRNDNTLANPDPQVIYISDSYSTEYGYYYLYGTNASNSGFQTYRSKDLQNWECMTNVMGYQAFTSPSNNVLKSNFWAPEVIYDEETQQYYMFYSGTKVLADGFTATDKYVCVAVADEPYGPFVPCTENGLDATKVLINEDEANAAVASSDQGAWTGFDPSPFIGADGEKYLVFCRTGDPGDDGYDCVWGMRMNSWSSPDYSTLTRLTSVGYTTTQRNTTVSYESTKTRNEAPCVYVRKHNDGTATYYLTCSINGSLDYQVIQAISDSPLGPYRKLEQEEGGILLGNVDLSWDHIQGPGHNSFVRVGEELFMFYHEKAERDGSTTDFAARFTAKDRVSFAENGNGQEVMVVNGPTWSLQPHAKSVSQYKNIASEAFVSATSGQNVNALTDGILSIYQDVDFVKEFETNQNTTTITLDFGKYRQIAGLMIYNSKSYNNAFKNISHVEFDFLNEKFSSRTTYIDNLEFDWNSYKNASTNIMRPGGSAVATFDPMLVKTIRITLEMPEEQALVAISEIAILGK